MNPELPKRPARWSLRNWPVRLKVLAIVLIPLLLALVFGGSQVYTAVNSERDMRLAADRVTVVPAVDVYISALQRAISAYSPGGDTQSAATSFDNAKSTLRSRLNDTEIESDVRSGVTDLLDQGQKLLDSVAANTIELRDRIAAFTPILLTAEEVITGSVRVDDARLTAQAAGLSNAVAVRGQMFMQQLLVDQGADLAEPDLRQSLVTVAGTEPSALRGVTEVLGVGSADADALNAEMVRRMNVMSNPEEALADNAALRESLQITDKIVNGIVSSTSTLLSREVQRQADESRTVLIRDSVIAGAGLLIALLTVWLVARSLIRPLRTLRDGALKVAHTDLAQGIDRVRAGDEREPEPLPIYTTEEIGQVAHAVDELHAQALLLAGEESQLRNVVNEMFETMSRRNRSLIDQQLSLIESLERNENDPARLESLFRLDHLATRMRRISANLLVLADAPVSHEKLESLSLASAINAAVSEVKDYQRVVVEGVPDSELVGRISGDTVHMMAELIDNALRYSPPIAPVRVMAAHTGNAGVLIEIHDDGIGMTEADLRIANMRLYAGGEVTPDNTRHMGLFVVSRLAHMHKMEVRLRQTLPGEPSSGTTAELYLPPDVLEHGSGVADFDDLSHRDAELQEAQTASEPVVAGWFAGAEPAAAEDIDAGADQPSDTSAFFGARERVSQQEAQPEAKTDPDGDGDETDLIYRRMMAEFTVDPHELAIPQDWESVWDRGWEAAAEVENAPIEERTEHGLPVRDPGARLVPGALEATSEESETNQPGPNRNGVASNSNRSRSKQQKSAKNEPDQS